MNYKMVGRFVAQILSVEAIFMVPALIISLCGGEMGAVRGFLCALAAILVAVAVLFLLCRKAPGAFYAKDGLACAGIGWMALSLLGCLPFYFSGEIPSFVDAFFEAVSGFTTTGASVVPNVEALSDGILYWRSFTHWLGGMGVLVFLLAISPGKGKSGFTMHLLRAESPGPDVGKLVPRMRKTAAILYIIYVVLTIVDLIFLLAGRMPLLDAVCTALGTAGTGGFGVRNDSLASYSPYIQNVTTVFMFLFGINFGCYYLLLLRQVRNVLKDEELRLYVGIVLGAIVLIVLNVRDYYDTLGETIRHAAFQVSSIITTSGFATTDFDLWPAFSKTILMGLMVVGACAGSTGGGLKCGRLLLLLKSLRRNTHQIIQPQRTQVVKNNGRVVPERVLDNAHAYLAAYVVILLVSILLISVDNFSAEANISAVLACFNNIGPGMAEVGPTCNFVGYSTFSKLVLSLDMLTGRLEIFPILVLFSRSTWKNR